MKKFFSAILLIAAMAFSVSTFVSCNDLTAEIEAVTEQAGLNEDAIKKINDEIATLKTALATAQATADAAKADAKAAADAAKKAQDTGDAAAKAAAEAKADAANAAAAAAQAKADAIKEAEKLANNLKAEFEKAAANFATKAELEAAKADLVTMINAINANLAKIEPALAAKVDTETFNAELAKILGEDGAIATQIAALKAYAETTYANKADVEKAIEDLEATLNEEITALYQQYEGMTGMISSLNAHITDLKDADAEIWAFLNGEGDSIVNRISQVIAAYTEADATLKAELMQEIDAILAQLNGVGGVTEQINSLITLIGDNTDAIAALKEYCEEQNALTAQTITFMNNLISTNAKDIAANATEITNLKAALKTLQETTIPALAERVESLEARMTAAEEAVKTINTNLAVVTAYADRLTSITFVPDYYVNSIPAIVVNTLAYDPMAAGENVNVASHENSNQYKAWSTAEAAATFRVNPVNLDPNAAADYKFVHKLAETKAAADFLVINGDAEYKDGLATFDVRRGQHFTKEEKIDIVALEATLLTGLAADEKAGDVKVYSEYVTVDENLTHAKDLFISDKDLLANGKGKGHHYAVTFNEAKNLGLEGQPTIGYYYMAYDQPFDLGAEVATCLNCKNFDIAAYDLHYRYAVATTAYYVNSDATKTNQQTVIECTDAEEGIFSTKLFDGKFNKETIGRTPILKVELCDADNNVVRRAFVKVIIGVERQEDFDVKQFKNDPITLACPTNKVAISVDEETMREAVYRKLDISHEEFWNTYDAEDYEVVVKKNGVAEGFTMKSLPEIVAGVTSDGRATKKVVWNFTHGEVGFIGTGARLTAEVTVTNKLGIYSSLPENITFIFQVDFKLPEPKVNVVTNNIYWKDGNLQANVVVPASATDEAARCQFSTPIAIQPWTKLAVDPKTLPCNETPEFRISQLFLGHLKDQQTVNYNDSRNTVNYEDYVSLMQVPGGEIVITVNKDNAEVKKALNSEAGLKAIIEWYAVAESGDEFILHAFTVDFIRPIDINMPAGLTVKDAVTGGDVVDFNVAGLLTDWRGEAVLPSYEFNYVDEGYFWNHTCSPADHAELVPGHYELVIPAKLETETQTITIPVGQGYYVATASYDCPFHGVKTATGEGLTINEAMISAEAALSKALLEADCLNSILGIAYTYETEIKYDTQEITIVKNVKYTEATYKWVDATIKYSACNAKPIVNPELDLKEGYTDGCWTWTKYAINKTDTAAGQYWDFYGPIDEYVTLATDKAKTNLDYFGNKLPSGATLVQDGHTVRYENVQSPIQYTYTITIPATINYGWGTLNTELVLTVNPVK